MKKLILAPLAALLTAFSANAGEIQTLTLREQPQSSNQLADIVEVSGHRSAGSAIVTDAVYGGVAGLAVGGAVALIGQDTNWGRDLAVGAGVGLLVGAIFGAVDAASYDRAMPPGFNSGYQLMGTRF
ncbi:MAG TPA: hypothetical protein VLW85_16780 [Myxococcales bacterium]|nr:hypothetical protein [Myxococcales bacterium]